MMALLSGFFSKAWGYVLAIGAGLAAIAGALVVVRHEGETAQQFADDQATLKTTKEATDVQNKVAAVDPASRRDELRQWATGERVLPDSASHPPAGG